MKQILGILFTILVFGVAFFAGRYSMHAEIHELCTSYDYSPSQDSLEDTETSEDDLLEEYPEEALEESEVSEAEESPAVPEVSKENIISFSISRQMLIKRLSDPNLLFQAHAIPHRSPNGQILGFKVLSLQPGSIYEEAGVKVQDILTHVDGNPLNDIGRIQSFYNGLRQAKELRFNITRQGVHNLLNVKVTDP